MTLMERISVKFPRGITLQNLMRSEEMRDYLPPGYLPTIIESDGCLFLQPESYVTTSSVSEKIFYLYMTPDGTIKNDPELSLVQMGLKWKGFLARLSVPSTTKIATMLQLDYLIDLENIHIITSTNMSQTTEGVRTDNFLRFDTIDPRGYPKATFSPMLTDFQMRKEELYKFLING